MDDTRKIVFIVFAIYLVLGIQFFFENGTLILPVDFNPIVLLLVAFLATIGSYKTKSLKVNVIYLCGLIIYGSLSERTLNIVNNYLGLEWIPGLIENPFTRLIQICGLFIAIIWLLIRYSFKNKKGLFPFTWLTISCCFGLANNQFVYVFSFSLFVLTFLFVNLLSGNDNLRIKFSGITYQLLLFALLENIFIWLH